VISFQHYRKKKSYALIAFYIFLAIFLSFSTFRNLFGLRNVLVSAIYPCQYVTVSLWQSITSFPSSVVQLKSLAVENRNLKSELAQIKPQLLALDELKAENERLRHDLGFVAGGWQYKLLPAKVIAKAPSPWFSTLTINQGSQHKVRKNSVIINDAGLVGLVVEVAPFTAKVLLLNDLSSSVAAVSQKSRDFGIVTGNLSDNLSMKYVASGGQVQPGDRIVTSPISTVFLPGLLIGTVTKATKQEHDLFYHIKLQAAVDFSRLEEVFVIL